MSLFYFSLTLSIFFSLLGFSLKLIAKYPKTWVHLNKLKGFNIIPKFIVISQIFFYRFFAIFSNKHKILFNLILYGSALIVLLGLLFRIFVIKHGFFVMDYFSFNFICLILCINTIFRSFLSFSILVYNIWLFTFLYLQQFFENLKRDPYWNNYVKELFERTKIREKLDLEKEKKV